jgi:WhiB family redox-sensing transcriptional regulator
MFAYSWPSGHLRFLAEDVDWGRAACRSATGSLTELFFSDNAADIELAKSICATCSFVQPCLEGALARREPAGVWGGELFVEGRVVAFKRKRGRPPKTAPATPGITEVAVPRGAVVPPEPGRPKHSARMAKLRAGQPQGVPGADGLAGRKSA